jgi:hypothetical protein
MKRWTKLSVVMFLIASTSACVVEERGGRGRTVVEERHHGHGHAYGHQKHGK